MPGYRLSPDQIKDSALFNKYKCHHCQLLLKDALQPSCGHWLCESCAEELLSQDHPLCPNKSCNESLKDGEDASLFPDKFVRREIKRFHVSCEWASEGCNWEGKLESYDQHLGDCGFALRKCLQCGDTLPSGKLKHECPKQTTGCPLAKLGCNSTSLMNEGELSEHLKVSHARHLSLIVKALAGMMSQSEDSHLRDSISHLNPESDQGYETGKFPPVVEADQAIFALGTNGASDIVKDGVGSSVVRKGPKASSSSSRKQLSTAELEAEFKSELRKKDDEIMSLKANVSKLERLVKSKHAEYEDRDFRLSLIENSNHDGTMVWKIPQFSQRMSDAQSGKYTSIFSLPFYTSRYGYKMCLRLYILGDGIGKGTYMSLFFVIMKGEFDNVLHWPFTHKVTFKLLNQGSGRDVVDTFQPDPMSSSFRKPKSDMNIASGCPRFVSHTELRNNGFIADDTIFIKCMVDINTVKHP